jgi:hypothetical protein
MPGGPEPLVEEPPDWSRKEDEESARWWPAMEDNEEVLETGNGVRYSSSLWVNSGPSAAVLVADVSNGFSEAHKEHAHAEADALPRWCTVHKGLANAPHFKHTGGCRCVTVKMVAFRGKRGTIIPCGVESAGAGGRGGMCWTGVGKTLVCCSEEK